MATAGVTLVAATVSTVLLETVAVMLDATEDCAEEAGVEPEADAELAGTVMVTPAAKQ